jgi:hypothetical protein
VKLTLAPWRIHATSVSVLAGFATVHGAADLALSFADGRRTRLLNLSTLSTNPRSDRYWVVSGRHGRSSTTHIPEILDTITGITRIPSFGERYAVCGRTMLV